MGCVLTIVVGSVLTTVLTTVVGCVLTIVVGRMLMTVLITVDGV
jgi:hypothetical protein